MFKLPIPTRLTDYLGEAVVWTVIIAIIYNIAFLRFLGPNLPGPNLPYRINRDRIYRDRINLAPIYSSQQ